MKSTWLAFLRKHTLLIVALAIHVLSVGGLVYAQQSAPKASVPVTLPKESEFPEPTVSGIPTEISVPSLGIHLTVEPGTYDRATDSWTLSGLNAHFATFTRPANNGGGNTFIYGHNNKHVFGPMKSIAAGAEVKVLTDIGNTFYYTLESTRTTDPSDVSLFTYTGAPILTVQTCTGVWHEQRQLYTFKLQRFEESSKSVAVRNEAQRQRLLQTVALATNPRIELLPQPQETQTSATVKTSVVTPPIPEKTEAAKPMTLASLITLEKPLFTRMQSN